MFLPEIKRNLGEHLIGEPPFEEDAEHNTDLIVLKMEPIRIACRIRKFKFWCDYPNEFTIRYSRPSGRKTEFSKLMDGWGDYFFYGFASPMADSLHSWFIGDLDVFRNWVKATEARGGQAGTQKQNKDGSSDFLAFDLTRIPFDFIHARSYVLPVYTKDSA